MAGKGDRPRPVNLKKYQENWEEIFSDKKDEKNTKKPKKNRSKGKNT